MVFGLGVKPLLSPDRMDRGGPGQAGVCMHGPLVFASDHHTIIVMRAVLKRKSDGLASG
jgi:hypothetical protein